MKKLLVKKETVETENGLYQVAQTNDNVITASKLDIKVEHNFLKENGFAAMKPRKIYSLKRIREFRCTKRENASVKFDEVVKRLKDGKDIEIVNSVSFSKPVVQIEEVLNDIVFLRSLGMTYKEIADEIAEKHGYFASSATVNTLYKEECRIKGINPIMRIEAEKKKKEKKVDKKGISKEITDEIVKIKNENNNFTWEEVRHELLKAFPGIEISRSNVRDRYRKETGAESDEGRLTNKEIRESKKIDLVKFTKIEDEIFDLREKKYLTFTTIADEIYDIYKVTLSNRDVRWIYMNICKRKGINFIKTIRWYNSIIPSLAREEVK